MLKKWVYIIVWCFTWVDVQAQEEPFIDSLIGILKKEIRKVSNDRTLSPDCKRAFQNYERAVPSANEKSWTDIKKKQISLKLKKELVQLKKECDKNSIKNLEGATNEFIAQLARSIPSQQLASRNLIDKDSTFNGLKDGVLLTIKVTDSSTDNVLNARLRIDSAGVPITRISEKDTGYFEAMLLPGKQYSINVQADEHKSFQSNWITAKEPESFIIKLGLIGKKSEQKIPLGEMSLTDLSHLSRQIKLLLFVVAVLFVLIVIISVVNFYAYKRYKLGANFMSALVSPAISTSATLTQPESPSSPESSIVMRENPQMEQTDTSAIVESKPTQSSFVCEIMMTAGPRKKFMSEENADRDLGEDVCGFISGTNQILIWLLDGTSDLHCLKNPVNKQEYFSSRLLAISLASKLRKRFSEMLTVPINDWVKEAIRDVRKDWLQVINQLPADEKTLLKNSIENKNLPECATTLLLARLSLNGDLMAYRSGDSKLFPFGNSSENEFNFVESSLVHKNEESNDRIFFRLLLNEQGDFDIIFNEPLHEIVTHENISSIILFSDGIGMKTESFLKESYKANAEKARMDIMYHSQETGDDKSICFIEIKQLTNP